MDNVLNLVFDNWDDINDVPLPNKSNKYNSPYRDNAWAHSENFIYDMKIKNFKFWKLKDVPNYPLKKFYYHMNHVSGFNCIFTRNIFPINPEVLYYFKKYKNLDLIFMNEHESENRDTLMHLHDMVNKLKIDGNKIWLISNSIKLEDWKNELETNINVYTTNFLSKHIYSEDQIVEHLPIKDKNNFFLCLNRRPKIHRLAILCLLQYHNILNDTNWSLLWGDEFTKDWRLGFITVFTIEDVFELLGEIKYFSEIETKKSNYEIWYTKFNEKIHSELPWEIKTYENSYVNIVTESNYTDHNIHISEKSYKPFYYCQFPIILASPEHIKHMKIKWPELDFFDDVIDHSYDNIFNDRDRLFAVMDEIKRIHKNKEFFIEFYKNNKDRFIKNRDIMINHNKKYDITNNPDLKFFVDLSKMQVNTDIKFV